jgi:YEATS domain-containing protein 4
LFYILRETNSILTFQKLYFQVTFYHILKLFQNSPEIVVGKKPVVSEFYEEIVFQEPTAMMHQLLTNIPQLTTSPVKHDADCKAHISNVFH